MRRRLTDEEARRRRDHLLWWIFGGFIVALLAGYTVADLSGAIPRRLSLRWRADAHFDRREDDTRASGLDPDLVLGIAIGDTRYWLNHRYHFAVVTRPCFWVTDWVIPEQVEWHGATYTVTALHTAALLYAEGVTRVSLPSTLRYTNQAEQFINPELATVELRRVDGSVKTYPRAQGFSEAELPPPAADWRFDHALPDAPPPPPVQVIP